MTFDQYAHVLMWVSIGIVIYTFVGYPLAMIVLTRYVKPKNLPRAKESPSVSVVVAMGDEAEYACDKVENLLNNGYPQEKMEVVAVLDAPTDDTRERLDAYGSEKLKVVAHAERRGKAACLNDGVATASGEVIVFCDARQTFRPGALPCLAKHFADPKIGAVSGELVIEGGEMGAYWKFEKELRKAESKFGSVMGCTGAIYAIRKELFQAVPDDTILDDVVIPMSCLTQGYSVKFDSEAVAVDPQPATMEFETKRKIRTLAGNWQMLFRHPSWLLPWRNRAFFSVDISQVFEVAWPMVDGDCFRREYCHLSTAVPLDFGYAVGGILGSGDWFGFSQTPFPPS